MLELRDSRDEEAQRYADRVLTDADWRLPSLLATSYNRPFRLREARTEFETAYRNRIGKMYAPMGPMSECYANVQRQIAKSGGSFAFGWQIMPHMLWEEGVHLEAHAVWRTPDNRLVEVTLGRASWGFAPCPRIKLNDQIVLTTTSDERADRLFRVSVASVGKWNRTKNPLAP